MMQITAVCASRENKQERLSFDRTNEYPLCKVFLEEWIDAKDGDGDHRYSSRLDSQVEDGFIRSANQLLVHFVHDAALGDRAVQVNDHPAQDDLQGLLEIIIDEI